jgi:[acyl-carrier-protein] S-malonyltransferase
VAAGALGTEDGMRLVARRGALMAGIQAERPGAMGAVIGLAPEDVEGLCRRVPPAAGHVAVANLNSPTQVAVSGEERAVEDLLALAREAGARRALRLPVGAAFHSSLMEPVRARLGDGMRTLRWSDAAIPLAANVSGRLIAGADEIRDALVAQIVSPVRWVDCVRGLAAAGCTAFLELGAGRVLAGLVRQIVPGADVASADSPGKLAAFAAGHGEFVTS